MSSLSRPVLIAGAIDARVVRAADVLVAGAARDRSAGAGGGERGGEDGEEDGEGGSKSGEAAFHGGL